MAAPHPKLDIENGKITLRKVIAKSDWAEKFLPDMGHRQVRMIQVPRFEVPDEWGEAADHVEKAWVKYMSGDYDETLTECRCALQLLTKYVQDAGFQKVKETNAEQRRVPHWEELLGGIGKDVERIERGLHSFCSRGPHPGSHASRPEAECALMSTQGLVSYTLQVLQKRKGLDTPT